MAWRLRAAEFRGLADCDFAALGIPTEAEYVAAYCRRTGRERIADWDFYLIFNMFRITAILHGVHVARAAGQRGERQRDGDRRAGAADRGCRLGHGAAHRRRRTMMDFEHSDKVKDLQARVLRFMEANVYPGRAGVRRRGRGESRSRQRVGADTRDGDAEGEGARGWPVEPVPARIGARRRTDQPRIRAAVRDHGPLVDRARGVQLQRAGHRQHGSAGALRQRGAEAAMAAAAARRRDPLGVRDDRAGRRVVGRDQHRGVDRARRRPLRRQRPQVVDHRRTRSALPDPHLHGQDRSGERGPPPAAVDDPDPGRHART